MRGFWYELAKCKIKCCVFLSRYYGAFVAFNVALRTQTLYTNFGTQTWQCKFSAQIL